MLTEQIINKLQAAVPDAELSFGYDSGTGTIWIKWDTDPGLIKRDISVLELGEGEDANLMIDNLCQKVKDEISS